MKNRLTLPALALMVAAIFLTGAMHAQDTNNDLAVMGMKGKVKSMIEKKIKPNNPRNFAGSQYLFNAAGNTIEYNLYENGKRTEKHDNKYDRAGRKIASASYDSRDSLISADSFKYDTKGREIALCTYGKDKKLTVRDSFKYDGDGNKIETREYGKGGSLLSLTTYKYDDKGNNIEAASYDKSGNLLSRQVNIFKYENGKLIESSNSNKEGKMSCKYTYSYDGTARKIESKGTTYDNDGKPASLNSTKFDKKGNTTEYDLYNADGSLQWNEVYKYDDKGNRSTATKYNMQTGTPVVDETTYVMIDYYKE